MPASTRSRDTIVLPRRDAQFLAFVVHHYCLIKLMLDPDVSFPYPVPRVLEALNRLEEALHGPDPDQGLQGLLKRLEGAAAPGAPAGLGQSEVVP